MRQARIQRTTAETSISLSLSLDGGESRIATGLAFFDHMLHQLAKHGGLGIELEAKGDLPVDSHHLIEDVALCLGDALREALDDRHGIARFGEAHVPLDESLARVVVDLSGRPYTVFDAALPSLVIGDGFQTEMVREFFIAIATRGQFNLHATVLYGLNTHHKIEALFKGLALALKRAVRIEGSTLPSTKGTLTA
ncbi:MAG TPA: imidazoleglycerol-phosphate dehydratase HisB [Holophagaceae bacterium]|jgi:imidazoleglycerol-phosphate dehydratase|nr:imidazoleglycerol-phosphate dehydratase HisB [Holophagaceae bacterium]